MSSKPEGAFAHILTGCLRSIALAALTLLPFLFDTAEGGVRPAFAVAGFRPFFPEDEAPPLSLLMGVDAEAVFIPLRLACDMVVDDCARDYFYEGYNQIRPSAVLGAVAT